MKNKLLTTVILSVLSVSLVMSMGIYALVADEEVETPEASAPVANISSDKVPETLDEANESPISNSEDYAFTEEYLDDLYWFYCRAFEGLIYFNENEGITLGLVSKSARDYNDGVTICDCLVRIPECYGRLGEDRPLEVYDSNKENPEDPYDKYVQIPYDELDSDLKRAVTARYRKYQEILDGGRMVAHEDAYFERYGTQESGFYPSAGEAVDRHDSVFRGKVVDITFEAEEFLQDDITAIWYYNSIYTIYEVEVVDPLKGNVSERVEIRVFGGHPTYGLDEQRKLIDEKGWSISNILPSRRQCAPERVLELNETYIFTVDVTYGISNIPLDDWSEIVIDPDTGLRDWSKFHCTPFAFKASEPSGNGVMAAGDPSGEASYENILAYINSKSNEADK